VSLAIPTQIGYAALAGFVAESARVPLPRETALIAAGLLAGKASA
jgi:membrane protein DedA with SNARE-associated domain